MVLNKNKSLSSNADMDFIIFTSPKIKKWIFLLNIVKFENSKPMKDFLFEF